MLFRTTVNITRISIGNMDFAYGITTFEIVINETCEKHSSIAFHSLAQFLVAAVERDGSWFLYLELHKQQYFRQLLESPLVIRILVHGFSAFGVVSDEPGKERRHIDFLGEHLLPPLLESLAQFGQRQ